MKYYVSLELVKFVLPPENKVKKWVRVTECETLYDACRVCLELESLGFKEHEHVKLSAEKPKFDENLFFVEWATRAAEYPQYEASETQMINIKELRKYYNV